MFGFFAFNGGSQLSISNEGDGAVGGIMIVLTNKIAQVVALAMCNTMLTGAAAATTVLILVKVTLHFYFF